MTNGYLPFRKHVKTSCGEVQVMRKGLNKLTLRFNRKGISQVHRINRNMVFPTQEERDAFFIKCLDSDFSVMIINIQSVTDISLN